MIDRLGLLCNLPAAGARTAPGAAPASDDAAYGRGRYRAITTTETSGNWVKAWSVLNPLDPRGLVGITSVALPVHRIVEDVPGLVISQRLSTSGASIVR